VGKQVKVAIPEPEALSDDFKYTARLAEAFQRKITPVDVNCVTHRGHSGDHQEILKVKIVAALLCTICAPI